MKFALAHLNFSVNGENKNTEKLEKAIDLAAEENADFLLTPETALQGYHFHKILPIDKADIQPNANGLRIVKKAAECNIGLFLCTAEYDSVEKVNYNSCLIFDKQGQFIGRHRKVVSHATGSEAWANKGSDFTPISYQGVLFGVMICADAWYSENAVILKRKKADILIDLAAWPYGPCSGDPILAWKKCSQETNLPMIVCNQTGKNSFMNMHEAESAILFQGKVLDKYHGHEAILICEWNITTGKFKDDFFSVINFS